MSITRSLLAITAIGLCLCCISELAGQNKTKTKGTLKADDWPSFRGPEGNGTSPAKNVPTTWGPKKNVKWKAPLPGPGNSSPIVAGDRVFITCAENEGQMRSLYCFRRSDGERLWVRTIEVKKGLPTHKTNPYCASTPATDGRRVVVWHGAGGLFCYDINGHEVWNRKLDKVRHDWGYAASPVIHQDRIYLNHGPGKPTFMAAVDLSSGKTLWRTNEPLAGNGEKRPMGGYIGTWATPILVKVDGEDQLICNMPTRVVAYDPKKGNILWSCEGLRSVRGDLAYSSPHVGNGVCVSIGGFRGPSIGVKLGGRGDVTESHQLWRERSNPQSIGSGVVIGEYLYFPGAGPSVIQCIEPSTGAVAWKANVGNNFWGSLVYTDGRVYGTDQRGTTLVFRPNPKKMDLVATNRLNERSNSTPAVCDGHIFIRTFENLYCIAE